MNHITKKMNQGRIGGEHRPITEVGGAVHKSNAGLNQSECIKYDTALANPPEERANGLSQE